MRHEHAVTEHRFIRGPRVRFDQSARRAGRGYTAHSSQPRAADRLRWASRPPMGTQRSWNVLEGAQKRSVPPRDWRRGSTCLRGYPAAPPSVLVAHCAFGGIYVPNAWTQHPATRCPTKSRTVGPSCPTWTAVGPSVTNYLVSTAHGWRMAGEGAPAPRGGTNSKHHRGRGSWAAGGMRLVAGPASRRRGTRRSQGERARR